MTSMYISYLDITYLMLFLVAGMCLISYIWIGECIKRLSIGLFKDLFKTLLWIIRWVFIYTIWLFLLEAGIVDIPLDNSLKPLMNSVFLAVLLMIVTYTAVKARHIGGIYGFDKR